VYIAPYVANESVVVVRYAQNTGIHQTNDAEF